MKNKFNCKICDKTQGFGGMGRSEGKFNYTNDFGGHLGEKIGNKSVTILMEDIDKILCLFGADIICIDKISNAFNVHSKGDCSGTTYSLSQAAASGVYLGRYLLNNR